MGNIVRSFDFLLVKQTNLTSPRREIFLENVLLWKAAEWKRKKIKLCIVVYHVEIPTEKNAYKFEFRLPELFLHRCLHEDSDLHFIGFSPSILLNENKRIKKSNFKSIIANYGFPIAP